MSQKIASLQNQARQQALSTWQRRMQTSQSARLRWAKARYTKYESVPDNAAAFRSVEAVWRPILRNSKVPSNNSHPSTHSGAGFPSVSAEDFLDLSGADLRAAVARSPAYTSSGADGWAQSDLLALPQSFWRPLSLILRGMALQGDFHKALQTVVTTLIPKKREASFLEDATCLRPISVTSLIYRCWAGALAKRIAMVLEASLPEEAFGFRSCTSAQIPMAAALLRSQTAAVRDQAQYFVNYDIQKCFDSVPWDYAAASLAACGVPQGAVAALKATWAGWRRVWCLQGRAQEASWACSNGLLQGDPTAPHVLAACLLPLIKHTRDRWPEVQISQFADDIVFSSTNASELEAAHAYLDGWLSARGMELQVGKCSWVCAKPDAPALRLPVNQQGPNDIIQPNVVIKTNVGIRFPCLRMRILRISAAVVQACSFLSNLCVSSLCWAANARCCLICACLSCAGPATCFLILFVCVFLAQGRLMKGFRYEMIAFVSQMFLLSVVLLSLQGSETERWILS